MDAAKELYHEIRHILKEEDIPLFIDESIFKWMNLETSVNTKFHSRTATGNSQMSEYIQEDIE